MKPVTASLRALACSQVVVLCLFMLSSIAHGQSERAANVSADLPEIQSLQKKIVFVHGAWGGGWDYRVLEQLLEEKGHSVHRITLTGHGERIHLMSGDINLDTHILDVINTIHYEELEDFILVGHSYGGMVVTGVADRIPEKIKHLVYMDALLPVDGESVLGFQTEERQKQILQAAKEQGNGISIPPFWPDWEASHAGHHPLGTWTQSISLSNQDAAMKIPATYILAYEEDPATADFKPYADRAKSRGWPVQEWQSHHNTQHHAIPQYVEFLDSLE